MHQTIRPAVELKRTPATGARCFSAASRALRDARPWMIALLFACVPAWSMPLGDARHLLARSGFGTPASELSVLRGLGREEAVERLLAATGRKAETPPPAWVSEPFPPRRSMRAMDERQRMALRRQRLRQGLELKAWWYREMLVTASPLTERMTLFWHGHFTSGLRKVRSPVLMYRQNLTLRRLATGSYRELLLAMARDPAMIVYLDNLTNRRGRPNENFARELLELFTLGESHYCEQDVKAAARAFTGWSVDRRTGAYRFRRAWHDSGVKTFLGRTGRWGGEDIIDIILEQPRAAEHITEKLWRAFISAQPDPDAVRRLAGLFREARYELKPVLRGLLASRAFFDPAVRGAQFKSPVELLVGTLRTFGVRPPDTRILVLAGRRLGQDLFDPPNVKGWRGGEAWITSDTLLVRQQILERFLRGGGRPAAPPRTGTDRPAAIAMGADSLNRWLAELDESLRSAAGVSDILLAWAPRRAPESSAPTPDLVVSLVLNPAYQLR